MDEDKLVRQLADAVREVLERAGVEVYGSVDAEFYQRWDMRLAEVSVKASVGVPS